MSASATPNALTRATTALIRRAASVVASASVAACDSTPSVSNAVSGETETRPVPVTTIPFADGSRWATVVTHPAASSRAERTDRVGVTRNIARRIPHPCGHCRRDREWS